jgi:release factor glutamine methyltransferase
VTPAKRESAWLIEAAAERPWHSVRAQGEVTPMTERRALELARRRAAGEPLQYLTGVVGFRRIELSVGPGVFIPRPETELLVERALQLLPRRGIAVDVGTGSGAIALALADERPDARVLATEASAPALEWARRNRARLGLSVELLDCDILSGLPQELRRGVDVIVSNPPYIAPEEEDSLPPEVVAHEPRDALFAPVHGTAAHRRIARSSRRWLRPGGWLVLEIAPNQGERVTAMFEEEGYVHCDVSTDLTGRPRIAAARNP